MSHAILTFGVLGALALALFVRRSFQRVTVREFESLLLYRNGKYQRTLTAGAHWLLKRSIELIPIDHRERVIVIPGQELLSLDNVGLKVSLGLSYKIVDARRAHEMVYGLHEAVYTAAHSALRSIVGQFKIEELLARRNLVGGEIMELTKARVAELGVQFMQAEIRDIMFPGELKKIFNEVVRAQKEAQAALERTRGETAALRNLANAAKLIEDHPAILQLRGMQTVSSALSASGHTLVMGVPNYLDFSKGAKKE